MRTTVILIILRHLGSYEQFGKHGQTQVHFIRWGRFNYLLSQTSSRKCRTCRRKCGRTTITRVAVAPYAQTSGQIKEEKVTLNNVLICGRVSSFYVISKNLSLRSLFLHYHGRIRYHRPLTPSNVLVHRLSRTPPSKSSLQVDWRRCNADWMIFWAVSNPQDDLQSWNVVWFYCVRAKR